MRVAVLFVLGLAACAALTPISTSNPAGLRRQCGAAPGPLFSKIPGPYPTDSWYTGLGVIAGNGDQSSFAAGPYPFMVQALKLGLAFSQPSARTYDGTSIHQGYTSEWLVGASEIPNDINKHYATDFDSLYINVRWVTSSDATALDAYLVQGSAYLTLVYTSATPVLTTQNGFTISSFGGTTVTAQNSVSQTGTRFVVVLNTGKQYVLYFQNQITITATTTTLTSNGQYSGYLRAAVIYNSGDSAILDQYSSIYATGGTVSHTVSGNSATVSFNWNVAAGDSSKLLMLSWPHHRKALVSPNTVNYQVLTLKGYQKGILGNVWNMNYNLMTNSWFSQNSIDTSCVAGITQALEYHVAHVTPTVPGDFYFWGGATATIARWAIIAEEIGRNDLVQPVIQALQASIAPWFNQSTTTPAAYETLWGGMINANGATADGVDFGNGYYNDHHFHYGYFLYVASVIAKHDSAWLAQHGDFITQFARDIGNPSKQDPYFTVDRHKDWFAGHSWASGIANGAGDRDEESTSEATNGYYGLYMWGVASGNQVLQDHARVLLATEISSVQSYWQLNPQDGPDTPYPEQAFRNQTTVGNVQSTQAGSWLFWGAQRVEIAAIQILPLTPASESLINNPPWVSAMYKWTTGELLDPTYADSWKYLIYAAHALVDSTRAYAEITNLGDWGTGGSAANALWWAATRGTNNLCTATSAPPTNAILKSKATGLYVNVAGDNSLQATVPAQLAAPFLLNYIPGGQTIQTGASFVGGGGGPNKLVANVPKPSSWETWRFVDQGNGYWAIQYMYTKTFVCVNATTSKLSSGYSSSSADLCQFYLDNVNLISLPAFPYGNFSVKSALNNLYVKSVGDVANTLKANSPKNGSDLFSASSLSSTTLGLFDISAKQYLSAGSAGANAITANRASPSGWETFTVVPWTSTTVVIQAGANGQYLTVQADGTLLASVTSPIPQASEFILEGAVIIIPTRPSTSTTFRATTATGVIQKTGSPNDLRTGAATLAVPHMIMIAAIFIAINLVL